MTFFHKVMQASFSSIISKQKCFKDEKSKVERPSFSKTISPLVSSFSSCSSSSWKCLLSLILLNHKRWKLGTFTNVLRSLRSSFHLFTCKGPKSPNSYCPWNFRTFNKNTTFLTYVVESSGHLELKCLPLLILKIT